MIDPKIFVDSDVIISSLISSTGAAHLLLHSPGFKFHISNYSEKELELVVIKLKLDLKKLETLTKTFFHVDLTQNTNQIKKSFAVYTSDPNDSHIIAAASQIEAQFLITYNLKHYKTEFLKRDFNLLTLTPAQLLQYLRSL